MEPDHPAVQGSALVELRNGNGGCIGEEPRLVRVVGGYFREDADLQRGVFLDGFEHQVRIVGRFEPGSRSDKADHVEDVLVDDLVVVNQVFPFGIDFPERHDLFLSHFQHLGPEVFHHPRQCFIRNIDGVEYKWFAFIFRLQADVGHFNRCQQQDSAAHLTGSAQHRNML